MSRRIKNSITTASMLLFFAALVFTPMLMKNEPLQWQAANAMAQYDAGNHNVAIESLREVATKLPNDRYINTQLIRWFWDQRQPERAIELCEQRLKQDEKSEMYLTLKRYSECEAGDFKAAWETFERLKETRTQRVAQTSDELNENAYFRALADQDLDTALDEIQRAIAYSTKYESLPQFKIPLPSRALIVAGLLSLNTGSLQTILPHLNRRIDVSRRALDNREHTMVESLSDMADDAFPLSSRRESDLDGERQSVEGRRRELAFLLVTRALLFEDLKQIDKCDLDRAQVVELGFEPQEVADMLPDDFQCQVIASQAVAFLDTRGFVLTRFPWGSPDDLIDGSSTGRHAIIDLTIASVVLDVVRRFQAQSPEVTDEERFQFKKTHAAVLHHRAMVLTKAGDLDAAALDERKIEKLGFDVDGVFY